MGTQLQVASRELSWHKIAVKAHAGHEDFSGRCSERRVAAVNEEEEEEEKAETRGRAWPLLCRSAREQRQHVPEEAEQTPADKA